MQCPKCNATMSHQQRTFSHESTLAGQFGDVSFASGYSCWNCGKWADDPLVIAKPMPKLDQKPPVVRREFTVTDRLVKQYSASILKMCKEGAAMESITRLLARICPNAHVRTASVQKSITRLKMGVLDGIQNL